MNSPPHAQSPDEIFDIVDENDRPIARATRAETHAKRLRHRAVHGWVFNTAGQILLQKRSLQKDTAPGLWDSSCSGHLDAGENYDTAILRELREELSLTPDKLPSPLFKTDATPATGNEFTQVYRLQSEGPFHPNPAEITELRWLAPTDLDAQLLACPETFSPTFAHLWRLHRQPNKFKQSVT